MTKRWLSSSLVNVNIVVILLLDVGQESYVRVGLDYMKKCTGHSRISTQDKVIWGHGWYDGQME